MRIFSSQTVVDFLWEDVICHYNCFQKLIIDGGSENKDTVAELAEKYDIKKVVISIYYRQANEIIECCHKQIINAFLKISTRGSTN